MPTRFRKTVTIFPGVKANISKGGVSFSMGRKGFTINVGKNGVRRTVSLPGTGISNTEYMGKDDDDHEKGKEGGLLDGAGAMLMGVAAADALDKDDDDDKPAKRAKASTRRKKKTRVRKEKQEVESGNGYALRGLMVFAAIAIAVYAGTQLLPHLPPTWPNDLMNTILQWAVQFGH
jgi:hypothetical protein